MEKDKLIRQLLQKGKDYTQQVYLVSFFLTFIILIVFVIRPTVNEYITRQKELTETKIISGKYQEAIISLNTLQSLLESHRSDFILLEQAVPNKVDMYQLTKDVQNSFLPYSAGKTHNFASYMSTGDIVSVTKVDNSRLKEYKIVANIRGDYRTFRSQLERILSQRRIKSINALTISRPKESSSGATLEMRMEIEAYYIL